MRRALFPGSFDPLTLGHYDIIKRGVTLFDELVIAIGINADKSYMFSLEDRVKFIEEAFKDEPKIKVTTYKGMTVDFCKKIDANFILKSDKEQTTLLYSVNNWVCRSISISR